VNDQGQVLIDCEETVGRSSPVLWTRNDGITSLGTTEVTALALNDRGEVVGKGGHASLWTATSGWQDLGTLGGDGSWPSDFGLLTGGGRGSHALNNEGHVVGYSNTPVGDRHAFLWTPTDLMVDLGTLGGSRSDAYALNEHGWVVGGSYHDPVLEKSSEGYHAFLWTATDGMVDLGTLGGSNSWAVDVNNRGMIVGQTSMTGNAAIRAFAWTASDGMVELPPLDGFSQSVPFFVNDSGQVVGMSFRYDTNPSENRRATMWLLPAPRDVTLPMLVLPATIAVDGTSPAGVRVTYAVSATDDVDPNPEVICSLASGSVFPLGANTVTCTATDAAGNSASGTFEILVKDANQQLDDAIYLIATWNLHKLGASLPHKLHIASHFIASGKVSEACGVLNRFLHQVRAQSGKGLTMDQAAELTMRGIRIRNVIGC
jgi:probable HAF family extracellular repeat protein